MAESQILGFKNWGPLAFLLHNFDQKLIKIGTKHDMQEELLEDVQELFANVDFGWACWTSFDLGEPFVLGSFDVHFQDIEHVYSLIFVKSMGCCLAFCLPPLVILREHKRVQVEILEDTLEDACFVYQSILGD